MRERLQLPERIKNAPELEMGLELYYGAFFDLHTCRGGWGDGYIPWTAIDEYCDRLGLSDDQREDMHYYIREMDEQYHQYREAEAESRRGGKGAKPS